jgi:hypothetical protein
VFVNQVLLKLTLANLVSRFLDAFEDGSITVEVLFGQDNSRGDISTQASANTTITQTVSLVVKNQCRQLTGEIKSPCHKLCEELSGTLKVDEAQVSIQLELSTRKAQVIQPAFSHR